MGTTGRPTALVVCSVSPYPPFGGGEKRTLRLIEAIRGAGASPHVITTTPANPDAVSALADRGILLEGLAPHHPGLSRRLTQHLARRPSPFIPELSRRLSELSAGRVGRPAFVQFEHTQNAYYHRSVKGAPVVLSLHNVDSEMVASLARSERPGSLGWLRMWNRWHSMRATERRSARRAEVVLCVSEHDASRLDRSARRLLVVPNGVDDELFEIDPELPDSETILFFGKYDYEPNLLGITRFLREAWPTLASERPSARLRLVGAALGRELAVEADSYERVDVVGTVERLEPELEGCSVALVPIWQGAGTRLKVLEALAAARPVVGTGLGVGNVGFVHERHGLVAEAPGELAAAVARVLDDRAMARRLAAAGRDLAERYRWSVVLADAESLYRDLIEAARGA